MEDWSDIEFDLYRDLASHDDRIMTDRWTQTLFDAALFDWDVSRDDRAAILEALRDRFEDAYGLDFDAVFDWEGFRESYDAAQ